MVSTEIDPDGIIYMRLTALLEIWSYKAVMLDLGFERELPKTTNIPIFSQNFGFYFANNARFAIRETVGRKFLVSSNQTSRLREFVLFPYNSFPVFSIFSIIFEMLNACFDFQGKLFGRTSGLATAAINIDVSKTRTDRKCLLALTKAVYGEISSLQTNWNMSALASPRTICGQLQNSMEKVQRIMHGN